MHALMFVTLRIILIIAILGLGSAAAQTDWDNTLAAAKKEGRVSVISDVTATLRDALTIDFQKRYGISVELFGSSGREVPPRVAANYPDVQLEQMPVDVCLQQMLFDPRNLDVIVSDNILGAALANQSVALVGSPALLPVGGRGVGHLGVYGPACGPMFDQAGLDSINPIGAILAAAMMLRHSFSLEREAGVIERAVDSALGSGMRTADIAVEGERVIGAHAMGEAIAAWVCQSAGQSQRSLMAEE